MSVRFHRVLSGSLIAGGLVLAGGASGGELMRSSPIISEVYLGVLAHDVGLLGTREEHGFDSNLEVLFSSPPFLAIANSPRPHLGVLLNSEGDTNQLYAGLTWGTPPGDPLLFEVALGASLHDGETDPVSDPNGKSLGCPLLFRGAVSAGLRFRRHHSLSLTFAHISNGGLCDENQGLDTFGIRYGYRF